MSAVEPGVGAEEPTEKAMQEDEAPQLAVVEGAQDKAAGVSASSFTGPEATCTEKVNQAITVDAETAKNLRMLFARQALQQKDDLKRDLEQLG